MLLALVLCAGLPLGEAGGGPKRDMTAYCGGKNLTRMLLQSCTFHDPILNIVKWLGGDGVDVM